MRRAFWAGSIVGFVASIGLALSPVRLNVPFFPDDTDQCGPSTLASVFSFWGRPTTPEALRKEIYIARLKGTLLVDLMLAAQSAGFDAELYESSIEKVQTELAAGHPLIAFINRGTKTLPLGHYVVITGIDQEKEGLFIHSGLKENQFVTYKNFLADWDKTNRSTLRVIPAKKSA